MTTPSSASDAQPGPTPAASASIESSMRQLRSSVRTSVALRGAALLCAVAAALVLVSLGLDRMFRLSVTGRGVADAIYLAILGWCAWRVLLRPLLLRLPDRILADVLERHFPSLDDAVRSAVDFLARGSVRSGTGGRPAPAADLTVRLEGLVADQAARRLADLDEGEVIDRRSVRWTLARGLAGLGLVVVLAIVYSETFSLWFRRNVLFADTPWPYRTTLEVEGFESGERGVPRGDPLEIRVRAAGEIPVRVSARILYAEETTRYNLSREGEGAVFVHRHPAVTEPFSFRVEGGDYRSPEYRVLVLERPSVESITVTLTPPEYTQADPVVSSGDLGELAAPEGSALSLEGTANKPLRRAWLRAEGREIPLEVEPGGREFRGAYRPESGGGVSVHLEDIEGVPPDRWLRFSVDLIPDRTPAVQLEVTGLGTMITPAATMPMRIRAKDDYRVDHLLLEWTLVGDEQEETRGDVPLEDPEEPGASLQVDRTWEVSSLAVLPPRRLNVRVGAVDSDGLGGPKTGFSSVAGFLVVTADRLSEEFLRREAEQRRLLERMIEEEKAVRDAVYTRLGAEWKDAQASLPDELIEEILSLARVERQHARQLQAIGGAIRQILEEMENNKIGEADDLRRLAALVIDPIDAIATSSMPEATRLLGAVRDSETGESRVDRGLDLAGHLEKQLEALESVLASMLRLEGFTEVVRQLRAIIQTQKQSREAAQKTLERQIEGILEGDDGIFEE